MHAAVLEGLKRVAIREVPVPEIGGDDILVKVDACGICGSDIRIISTGNRRVRYPQIIGHEIAGTVVKVGKNRSRAFKVNDRVSLGADIPCGKCALCKTEASNLCEAKVAFGHEIPGGFAQFLKLDSHTLDNGPVVVIPKGADVTPEELALCEPLACCINGMRGSRMSKGKTVLIVGAGAIGCLLAMLARHMGASHVALCDIDSERLKAAEVCGADSLVLAGEQQFKKLVSDVTSGRGFDIIIVACSSTEAQGNALRSVRKRGVVNFFCGLPAEARHARIDSNLVHYNEVVITGSHGSSPAHHKEAVELVLRKKIPLSRLISRTFPLKEFHLALEEMATNKSNLKILILPNKA